MTFIPSRRPGQYSTGVIVAEEPVQLWYKSSDRRSSNGYTNNYGGDHLFKASRPSDQRKRIPDLNRDIFRNVSAYGRRTLATVGSYLHANVPVVHGAINEMAYYAVSTWIAQYYGRDPDWGLQAESWLYENDKILCFDGTQMLDYLRAIIIAPYVVGDIGTVYTETPTGYPKVQLIASHRIRSDPNETVVATGAFAGAKLIDGVISDDYGAPLAYRVWTDDVYRDIPATGMMLHFIREFPGQLRGLSQLACPALDLQDIRESKDLDIAAQKLASSIGLIVANESGEADPAKQRLRAPQTPFHEDGTKAKSYGEVVDGVSIRYVKAGTGSGLSEFNSDKPSVNSRAFKQDAIREALAAIGFNYDFFLDPSKVGGVSGRICVTKINQTLGFIRGTLVRPASARLNGFRIRKAIKLGDLPEDIDWWKLEYQGPAKLTGDEKYSSDVAIQEIRAGIKTPQVACGERELWWQDVIKDLIAYEKFLQTECAKAGVDPARIILLTPNGNPPAAAVATPEEDLRNSQQKTEDQ